MKCFHHTDIGRVQLENSKFYTFSFDDVDIDVRKYLWINSHTKCLILTIEGKLYLSENVLDNLTKSITCKTVFLRNKVKDIHYDLLTNLILVMGNDDVLEIFDFTDEMKIYLTSHVKNFDRYPYILKKLANSYIFIF